MLSSAYVGVPTYGPICRLTVASLLQMSKSIPQWPISLGGELPTHLSRNQLVSQFLKTQYEVLLMIDSDMVFTPMDAHEIVNVAKRRQAVVGGLYVARRYPHMPCVRGSTSEQIETAMASGGEMVSVQGVGTGFIAIPRMILMEMEFPWFFWPQFKDMGHITDDYYFCAKARKAGRQVYVHTGVSVGHVGDQDHRYSDWVRTREDPAAKAKFDKMEKDNQGDVKTYLASEFGEDLT